MLRHPLPPFVERRYIFGGLMLRVPKPVRLALKPGPS
jgi:hypothetical protein